MNTRQQHRMPDRLTDRSWRYLDSAVNDLIEDLYAMPPKPGSFDTRMPPVKREER